MSHIQNIIIEFILIALFRRLIIVENSNKNIQSIIDSELKLIKISQ